MFLAWSALVLALAMLSLWLLSLGARDASIVDIFWGPWFVLVAWTSAWRSGRFDASALLLLALVTVWGLRLGGYLAWRNLGKGEDYRYRAMRARWGPRWPLWSLFVVFGLQGGLIWVVSLPLQTALAAPQSERIAPAVAVGVVCWGIGLVFETVGDAQLARFRRARGNKGKVMNEGLWAWTRHPNYFGDFMVWWGHGLVALAIGAPWWALAGPAVMSVLLLRVSGVTLLESHLRDRREGYDEYIRTTSSFFPRPPRARRAAAGKDRPVPTRESGPPTD